LSEKNQQNQHRNFFDSLMFGPPRNPNSEQQQFTEDKITSGLQTVGKENTNSHPGAEIDLVQMMQQFDMIMGYANKLGPTLKKIGPVFDLLKTFNIPKK
jgi:hypothetical protein